MHRVLWDVHAHAHHPLIEEMLMHMRIGWNTTIYQVRFSIALYELINNFLLKQLLEQEKLKSNLVFNNSSEAEELYLVYFNTSHQR